MVQITSTRMYYVFGFIKKTRSYGNEKMYLLYIFPPWAPHTYVFVVLTSLTHPREILLVVLQIGKAKDLSATLRTLHFLITLIFLRNDLRDIPGLVPTAAVCVRALVRWRGIYGGRSGTEASSLSVLRFPLPILIPPTAPHLVSIHIASLNKQHTRTRSSCRQWMYKKMSERMVLLVVLSEVRMVHMSFNQTSFTRFVSRHGAILKHAFCLQSEERSSLTYNYKGRRKHAETHDVSNANSRPVHQPLQLLFTAFISQ
jgi:hypothetical protein